MGLGPFLRHGGQRRSPRAGMSLSAVRSPVFACGHLLPLACRLVSAASAGLVIRAWGISCRGYMRGMAYHTYNGMAVVIKESRGASLTTMAVPMYLLSHARLRAELSSPRPLRFPPVRLVKGTTEPGQRRSTRGLDQRPSRWRVPQLGREERMLRLAASLSEAVTGIDPQRRPPGHGRPPCLRALAVPRAA